MSKALSALALLLIIIILCVTFSYRGAWWGFIDIFCFFMAAFLHLLATMQPAALRRSAHRIDFVAMIFAGLGILAFIGEAIAFNCCC